MTKPRVGIKRIGEHGKSIPLPRYQTPGSAGLDLHAAIAEPHRLGPGERHLFPTGLALELPAGFEAQVRPRSGLALRHGVTVLNAPGTIDSDYRGEIGIVLINHGNDHVSIEPTSRIAQLVITRYEQVELELREQLSASSRGSGGYGSTGG